jgi:hypothetical protein
MGDFCFLSCSQVSFFALPGLSNGRLLFHVVLPGLPYMLVGLPNGRLLLYLEAPGLLFCASRSLKWKTFASSCTLRSPTPAFPGLPNRKRLLHLVLSSLPLVTGLYTGTRQTVPQYSFFAFPGFPRGKLLFHTLLTGLPVFSMTATSTAFLQTTYPVHSQADSSASSVFDFAFPLPICGYWLHEANPLASSDGYFLWRVVLPPQHHDA